MNLRSAKILASMLLGILATHVVFSFGVSRWATYLLQHRMINVRHVDGKPDLWPQLISSFLSSVTPDPRPKLIIVGSSFSWGYSWEEKDAYPSHLQDLSPANKVINASIIGGSLDSAITTLCLAKVAKTQFKVAVIEFSMPNSIPGTRSSGEPDCNQSKTVSSFMPYLLELLHNPRGLGSFRIFWDEYNYWQKDRDFAFSPLNDKYFPDRKLFDSKLDGITKDIKFASKLAREVAQSVYIFPAPILQEGVALSQFRPEDIEAMQQKLVDICLTLEGVTCLDATPALQKKDYANLTHLNKEGHKTFATWLGMQMERPKNSETAPPDRKNN